MTRQLRKRSKIRRLLALLLLVIVLITVHRFILLLGSPSLPDTTQDETTGTSPLSASPLVMPSESLYSPYAILVRLDDGAILMQSKSEDRIYPASLTKIMTAVVAIENLPDLQEQITLPASIFRELYRADASMAGFKPNETVSATDLLYGALLPSGAESCIGLADRVAGSEQSFVAMMNEKAADLGMKGTHFSNVTGLHDRNHYTTAKDLAILLRYALHDGTFREIFTSVSHTTQPTNLHPQGITFASTMFEKLNFPTIVGGRILGGKTGYTEEAGLCLASLANKGGTEYILVTAGAKGDHETEQYNIVDALTVYNNLGKQ